MRIAFAIAVLLLAASSAFANPIECVLWPRSAGCRPVPVAPPPAPVVQPAPAPAPVIVAPPQVTRPIAKPAKPKPAKAKARPRIKSKWAKPKRRAVDNSGPDLPWPCWMVRINAAGKSNAELAAEGRRRGIKLSAKQERQALACLGRA